MGFFLNFLFAHVGVVAKNSEKNRSEKLFVLDAAVFWGNQFLWTQLTLNGLYKEKLQFSRYWTATCSRSFVLSRRLIWAFVESGWIKNKGVMNFQSLPLFGFQTKNRHFSVLGIMADFFYSDYMLSYPKKSEKILAKTFLLDL